MEDFREVRVGATQLLLYCGACGPIATSLLSGGHKGGKKTLVEQLHMSPVQGELAAADHMFSGCVRGRGEEGACRFKVCEGRAVSVAGALYNTQS